MTPYQAALAKKKTKKKAKHAKSYGGAEWVKYGDAASGKTTLHPAYITPLPVVGPSLKTDIGLAHGIKPKVEIPQVPMPKCRLLQEMRFFVHPNWDSPGTKYTFVLHPSGFEAAIFSRLNASLLPTLSVPIASKFEPPVREITYSEALHRLGTKSIFYLKEK
jgi:hypothetical protein